MAQSSGCRYPAACVEKKGEWSCVTGLKSLESAGGGWAPMSCKPAPDGSYLACEQTNPARKPRRFRGVPYDGRAPLREQYETIANALLPRRARK